MPFKVNNPGCPCCCDPCLRDYDLTYWTEELGNWSDGYERSTSDTEAELRRRPADGLLSGFRILDFAFVPEWDPSSSFTCRFGLTSADDSSRLYIEVEREFGGYLGLQVRHIVTLYQVTAGGAPVVLAGPDTTTWKGGLSAASLSFGMIADSELGRASRSFYFWDIVYDTVDAVEFPEDLFFWIDNPDGLLITANRGGVRSCYCTDNEPCKENATREIPGFFDVTIAGVADGSGTYWCGKEYPFKEWLWPAQSEITAALNATHQIGWPFFGGCSYLTAFQGAAGGVSGTVEIWDLSHITKYGTGTRTGRYQFTFILTIQNDPGQVNTYDVRLFLQIDQICTDYYSINGYTTTILGTQVYSKTVVVTDWRAVVDLELDAETLENGIHDFSGATLKLTAVP